MRTLLFVFMLLLLVSALFATAHPSNTDDSILSQEELWIQSLLREQDISTRGSDFIFYCIGHHGHIWSLITSDSSGIRIFNGTTRKETEQSDDFCLDTLSFINDNTQTIAWGFDTLLNSAPFFAPLSNAPYQPFYKHLSVKRNGNLFFKFDNHNDYYAGEDSIEFHEKFGKLQYLMYWLAAQSIRMHLPVPSDTNPKEP